VTQTPNHRWIVMGYLAWIWVPTMEGEDTVGSLGIDIAGVAEDDRRWFGKLVKLVGDGPVVEVDRTARPRLSPAKRRQLGESCAVDPSAADHEQAANDEGESS
jgi:hypothetical protein